jgi:hypothetical protein
MPCRRVIVAGTVKEERINTGGDIVAASGVAFEGVKSRSRVVAPRAVS